MPHLSVEDRKLPDVFCLRPASASPARTPAAPVSPAHGHHTPGRDKGSDGHMGLCSRTPNGDRSHPGPGSGTRTSAPPHPHQGWKQALGSRQSLSLHPPLTLLAPSFPAARWPFVSASTRLLCPSPRLALAVHSCQNCKFTFQNNQQKINHISNPIPSSWEGERHRSV